MTLTGTHDYDIVVTETDTGNKFELFYSLTNDWTHPGDLILTLNERDKDSSVDLPKIGRNIDISLVNELALMLKFILLHGQEHFADDLHYKVVSAEGYKI